MRVRRRKGAETVSVPILKQGDVLIASIQAALSDRELAQLHDAFADQVGRFRSRGVIIDVTALDVLDSFATRTLRSIAYTAKLRGANAVVVGIQPDAAFAMVQLGLSLEGVATALDLEEGLAYIRDVAKRGGHRVRSGVCLHRVRRGHRDRASG